MRKKILSALILLSILVSSFSMVVPQVNASAVSPTNEQKPYVLTKDETGEVVKLTLYKDLVIPKKFLLENEHHLTVQSAEGQKHSLSLGVVTHNTPVNEEIFDANEGTHLILKKLNLGRKVSKSRCTQPKRRKSDSGRYHQRFYF